MLKFWRRGDGDHAILLAFEVYSQSSLDACRRKGKLIENLFSTQRQIEYLSESFRVNFNRFALFLFENRRKILKSKRVYS